MTQDQKDAREGFKLYGMLIGGMVAFAATAYGVFGPFWQWVGALVLVGLSFRAGIIWGQDRMAMQLRDDELRSR
jgi:hypothetical protein